ncbi:MAG: 4Fe-4S binding protein [Thermoplasmata archaeon]|nr:4Fe-4S binding protein [Thermoplasmata archaeon]
MTIQVDADICVLCGLCTGVCPPGALELEPERLLVRENCNGCGLCEPYCPVGALSGGRLKRRRHSGG